MSGLDQVKDRYHSDASRAQRTTEAKLKFALENKAHLRNGSSPKVVRDAEDIQRRHSKGERFTPAQMDYIDRMYEYVMKGMGLEHVPVHVDRKRKGLRYG